MRTKVRCCALILLLAAGCGGRKDRPHVPLIPLEDLFRRVERIDYKLSPDGERVSFLMLRDGLPRLFVQRVRDTLAVCVTEGLSAPIRSYSWADSAWLACIVPAGPDADRALAVPAGGGRHRELVAEANVKLRLVEDLEAPDGHVFLSMNRRSADLFDLYRVDARTGELELVAENPGGASGWIADHKGAVRVATSSDGIQKRILYRDRPGRPFRTILTADFKETVTPLLFTFDDRRLYVRTNRGRDTQAVCILDPASGELLDPVYEHPEVDVERLMVSRARRVLTGVSYVTDRRRHEFFDEDRRRLQEELEALFPGLEVTVLGMSRDENRVLARAQGDRSPGVHAVYDRTAGELLLRHATAPWLEGMELAAMRSIHFTARDGLVIHGYLTLPTGVEPRALPVVVLPHGGPHARDRWGFDPEVQFLANRGYAVLQVNFRGSTGYGRSFWQAGFRQWGRAMQDDLTDGVSWLVEQGIAHPERIGILGHSYGGYAVLAGLAFTPDLYACGADDMGFLNLFTLLDAVPPYWPRGRQMFHELIGDPVADARMLRAVSPLFHADSIRAPLLVVQNGGDPRVPKSETDRLVARLRERGVEVEYVTGGAGARAKQRLEFYRAVEAFLARHLGGRRSPEAEE